MSGQFGSMGTILPVYSASALWGELLGYLYLINKMHDQAPFGKELILAYDSRGMAKICNSKQGGNR